jgi:predicted lactoylglutathione lyase
MKQIFINIPVNDLEKSMKFYSALGFTINPLFTDKDQKCMIWSDSIYIMLQSRTFTNTYINKEVIDANKFQMPSFTLPVNSIDQVNEIMESGLNAGGKEPVSAIKENFMYLRSIQDVDGYIWGLIFLEIDKFTSLKNHSK